MSAAAVAAPGATRARASFASASSRRRVTPPESAFSPRPGPTVRWARPLRVATPRRRLVSTNAERPDGPEKEGDDESDADLPLGMSRNTADLLNLLVVTGGVRGSIAVVVGAAVGINALGMIHPDAQSTIHGLEWALPVLLVDALVMLPTWDLGEAAEDAIDAGDRPLGKPEKIRRALSRYQREEALSNPCRSMPAWQDALVGFTARLTDEMLDRAVVLGFIAAWVTDRAVRGGRRTVRRRGPGEILRRRRRVRVPGNSDCDARRSDKIRPCGRSACSGTRSRANRRWCRWTRLS